VSAALSYKASEKLIWKMAGRVLMRLKAAGARQIDREDVIQELSIAWVKATESFDPHRGVPFPAYFVRGAWQHINRWAEGTEEEIRNVGPSLDATLGDEGNDRTLGDMVEDRGAVSAEQMVLDAERRALVYRKLSPRAAQFLELLENPPPALYAQMDAISIRASTARTNGRASWAPNYLSMTLIADLMGLDKTERRHVYAELNELAIYVQRISQK
jgi:hypothetical protein